MREVGWNWGWLLDIHPPYWTNNAKGISTDKCKASFPLVKALFVYLFVLINKGTEFCLLKLKIINYHALNAAILNLYFPLCMYSTLGITLFDENPIILFRNLFIKITNIKCYFKFSLLLFWAYCIWMLKDFIESSK